VAGAIEFPHCGKGTDQVGCGFQLVKHGVDHDWTSEGSAFARSAGAEDEPGAKKTIVQEDIAKALVAARDTAK
jgi:hypothetical protein